MKVSAALLYGSLLAAGFLALLPLPDVLLAARPYWLALVLIFWVLEAPSQLGFGRVFLIGVLADVLYGSLLGEQALRLCVILFLVLRFRPRLRFFPLSQQALAVGLLLLNDRVVTLAIRLLSGEGVPPASFWIAPLIGALIWPWVFLLLDQLLLRGRRRAD
nr:rod shape-determining protein MreD [Pseudomarimonas arenosa]